MPECAIDFINLIVFSSMERLNVSNYIALYSKSCSILLSGKIVFHSNMNDKDGM